ncbi:MAG: VWA domain-containing protein, partial [Planctomycetota bacterium]
KAMPVDFQIKAAKVTPVGALVLMMHAGEMPQSNYWQKRIAVESIRLLGPRDYCGLVQWNGTDQWLWGQSAGGLIRVGPNRRAMLGQVDRMQIGDMPQFDPAMKMAATAFAGVKEAAIKHMIIISDGDPTPPTPQTIRRMKQQGVKISTVAVPSHGGVGNQIGNVMQDIARQTGGKYYVVRNASALPKIYQREARRIARPLVYEPKPPASPVITANHEMLQGLETGFPPISGFVLTTVKENPLVEVLLQSPVPPNPKNSTVLATWTYGAGRSAVLTTDAGKRWAGSWVSWDGYEKFFTQLVRWAMRPTGDTGNFSVATDIEEGRTRVVITALDEDEDFLNDLAMNGSVVSPELSTIPLRIEQTAPGRYVAEFDSEQSGSYLIVINPGGGRAPIRTGVNVGYSAEYRSNETNLALLQSVAKLPPEGGPPGVLIEEGLTLAGRDKLIEANPFRRDLPPAVANRSIWPPLVLIACCAFFADVFVRRVQVNLDWVGPLWTRFADRVLRRPSLAPAPETMSRLRSRKQQVGQQIESRRGATRFESGEAPPPASAVAQAQSAAPTDKPKADKPASIDTPDEPPQESYTERLLKAKKNVWKEDDKK